MDLTEHLTSVEVTISNLITSVTAIVWDESQGAYVARGFHRSERFLLREFNGATSTPHPEWSKGWAYGADGAWTSSTFLHDVIPAAVQGGTPSNDGWQAALTAYGSLDPHGVYGNAFLDGLMTD